MKINEINSRKRSKTLFPFHQNKDMKNKANVRRGTTGPSTISTPNNTPINNI